MAHCEDGEGAKDGAISRIGNRIFFYKSVDQKSMFELVELLYEVESDVLSTGKEWEIPNPPIHLHISSHGGEVYAALAAMDHIRACKVPVYTYVDGAAASAATFLTIVGTKRFIYPNAYMLIHQISSGFGGKYEEFKDEMENYNALMAHMTGIYGSFTNIPPGTLKSLLKRDLWLPAEKCVKWGLVDEICGPKMPGATKRSKTTKKTAKRRSKKKT